MNANEKYSAKGTSNLVRPRYSPGLLLRDDDLRQGIDYTRDLSRLLFRSLVGCGVVCGLRVGTKKGDCGGILITIDEGVALDCRGDPIHVPEQQKIDLFAACNGKIGGDLWVALKRREKLCAPRETVSACGDDDEPAVCTRAYDGFEIRIFNERVGCDCSESKPDNDKQTDQTPRDRARTEIVEVATGLGSARDELRKAEIKNGMRPLAEGLDRNLGGAIQTTRILHSLADADAGDAVCADKRCHEKHYDGVCACACCDCDWVLLAKLSIDAKDPKAISGVQVDHVVRRFIRPVLMCDPVVVKEKKEKERKEQEARNAQNPAA